MWRQLANTSKDPCSVARCGRSLFLVVIKRNVNGENIKPSFSSPTAAGPPLLSASRWLQLLYNLDDDETG